MWSTTTSTTSLGRVGNLAAEHLAGEAVDRDRVALAEHVIAPRDAHGPGLVVDLEHVAADDAHLAHLPADQRRVARHAAAGGEDALGGGHAADVLRRGLVAHQDHALARAGQLLGVLGVEGDHAGCRAGAGVEAAGEQPALALGVLLRRRVEHGPQQLVQALGLDAQQRLLRGDEPLVHHLDGDAGGGGGGALPDAALQHVEGALLDRELDVHDVAVVPLERAAHLQQLLVDRRVLALELAIGSGVRMPATTSSPCAFIRNSP